MIVTWQIINFIKRILFSQQLTRMAVPPGLIVRKDKFGNDIWLGDGGEVIFAPVDCIPDYRKHLQHIRDMQLRADDVLIVGYPKSGQ